MARTATTDGKKIGGRGFALATPAHTVKPLAECMGDGSGHGLSGFVRQELGKLVSFGILNIETHASTILD
jgi:hypothetical protein